MVRICLRAGITAVLMTCETKNASFIPEMNTDVFHLFKVVYASLLYLSLQAHSSDMIGPTNPRKLAVDFFADRLRVPALPNPHFKLNLFGVNHLSVTQNKTKI